MSYDVEKPDEQWRAELTPSEYAVLRQAATEPAFTGEYTNTKTEGVDSCRALVCAHSLPRLCQEVTPVDAVVQRVKATRPTLLGRDP